MKESVAEIRKREIIETAMSLFIDHGFDKTSVTEIARGSKVTKGLVYYYFETKEDLLASVLEALCQRHIGILKERMDVVKGDFFAELLVLIDVYADLHPYMKYKNINDFNDSRLVAEFHVRYLEAIHEQLYLLTHKGQEAGYINLEYPEEMVIMALEGLYGIGRVVNLTQSMVATLVEQTLNLPKDSLGSIGSMYLSNYNEKEGYV